MLHRARLVAGVIGKRHVGGLGSKQPSAKPEGANTIIEKWRPGSQEEVIVEVGGHPRSTYKPSKKDRESIRQQSLKDSLQDQPSQAKAEAEETMKVVQQVEEQGETDAAKERMEQRLKARKLGSEYEDDVWSQKQQRT